VAVAHCRASFQRRITDLETTRAGGNFNGEGAADVARLRSALKQVRSVTV
jgi:hypothetical protein